jgi:hypothetical protein
MTRDEVCELKHLLDDAHNTACVVLEDSSDGERDATDDEVSVFKTHFTELDRFRATMRVKNGILL